VGRSWLNGRCQHGYRKGPAKHVDATSVRDILSAILRLPSGVINISLSYMGSALHATECLIMPKMVHTATGMTSTCSVTWPSCISLHSIGPPPPRTSAMESLQYSAPRRIVGSFPATPWCVSLNFEALPKPSSYEQLLRILLVAPRLTLIHLPSATCITLPFTWFINHQKPAPSPSSGKKRGGGKKKESKSSGSTSGNTANEPSEEELNAMAATEDAKRWHPNVLNGLPLWFSVDGTIHLLPLVLMMISMMTI
jgi:hypothetical protein